MASPSEAEVQSMIANAIELLEETRKFGETNAENWVGKEDTFIQSLEADGPLITAFINSVDASRASLAGTISDAQAAAIIGAGLSIYARHILNKPNIVDPTSVMTELYEHFIDNTLRVTSRQFTFGSPTADAGNTGDGAIVRLNTDARNFDIESQHADAKRATVTADQNSRGGVRHEEVLHFEGQAPGLDALQRSGSGEELDIKAFSARNSLLLNASFSDFAGTASAPTGITNWTSDVAVNGTNYDFDGTNIFRDFEGDPGPFALNIKTNVVLNQRLSVRRTKLDPARPYMLQVAFNRAVGAATGTLTIRMGSQNNNVVLAAQTGYNLLRVPGTPGTANWFENFNEDNLDISIETTGLAGELLVDDVLFIGAREFDGSWYWPIGGATPWLAQGHDGDFFTWTDTEVGSILQVWFWRAFDRYLPHTTGGGVTWAEP